MTKVKRKIITIEEELCNGCGDCIIECPEQALQLVETENGLKARLVKELYCDGLGACLGSCPTGALLIEEKEVEVYDEEATIARIKEVAPEMLEVHLQHMQEHEHEAPQGQSEPPIPDNFVCPSSRTLQWEGNEDTAPHVRSESELRQWPVQLHLVSPMAPYFQGADLLLVADCVPFAYANFHQDFLKGNAIAIACPKLDHTEPYLSKLTQLIAHNNLRSIKVLHMEVPCCFGLAYFVQQAMDQAGKQVSFETVKISVKGEIL